MWNCRWISIGEARIVVNTSVQVSAWLTYRGSQSPSAQLLNLLKRKFFRERSQRMKVVRLVSLSLLAELREVLIKCGFPTDEIAWFLYEVRFFSEPVEVTEDDLEGIELQAPPEAQHDIHVLACAIKGKATHIVTYDEEHMLTPKTKQFAKQFGIEIIKPSEMLAELKRLGDP